MCVKGEPKFRVVAAASRKNDTAAARSRVLGVQWLGSESDTEDVVHAEAVILSHKYNDKEKHFIVAIAATLCICKTYGCENLIGGRNAQFESPVDKARRTGKSPSVCTNRMPNRSEYKDLNCEVSKH